MFIKLSVLLFYRRLVSRTTSFNYKIAIWSAMAFIVLYTVAFTLELFLACRPFNGFWNRYNLTVLQNDPGSVHCQSPRTAFVSATIAGALSVFSDWFSVMLPAVLLLQHNISVQRKLGLMIIFALGYMLVFLQRTQPNANKYPQGRWSRHCSYILPWQSTGCDRCGLGHFRSRGGNSRRAQRRHHLRVCSISSIRCQSALSG
jgi:hypothetical protein